MRKDFVDKNSNFFLTCHLIGMLQVSSFLDCIKTLILDIMSFWRLTLCLVDEVDTAPFKFDLLIILSAVRSIILCKLMVRHSFFIVLRFYETMRNDGSWLHGARTTS